MSVAVLISGSIFREPQQWTSSSGRKYVTTTVKAAEGAVKKVAKIAGIIELTEKFP